MVPNPAPRSPEPQPTERTAPRPGSRDWLVAVAVGLAPGLIGVLDHLTGPEYGLWLLYLVPVVAAGWILGPGSALVSGAAAGVSWFLADYLWYGPGHEAVSLWNGVTGLAVFLGLGLATARLRKDREDLRDLNRRLHDLLEHESATARTDALTGLPNRRALLEVLERELARVRRAGGPVAVLYLDLDNFKEVNDRLGHAAGDDLLREVAGRLRSAVRADDVPARIGGDEFAVLLPSADREVAREVAGRVLERVTDLGARHPECGLGTSVGVAFFPKPPAGADEVLGAADGAMYRSKQAGKGRVTVVTAGG